MMTDVDPGGLHGTCRRPERRWATCRTWH